MEMGNASRTDEVQASWFLKSPPPKNKRKRNIKLKGEKAGERCGRDDRGKKEEKNSVFSLRNKLLRGAKPDFIMMIGCSLLVHFDTLFISAMRKNSLYSQRSGSARAATIFRHIFCLVSFCNWDDRP